MIDWHNPSLADAPVLASIMFAGACASGVNAFAGGGSLISFPALILSGIPPQIANATNSVALFPGSAASAYGFRNHLKQSKATVTLLLIPTIFGSICGSLLLINTPKQLFRYAVPILILIATLLLLFQPWIRKKTRKAESTNPMAASIAQFAISVYGGYFGAGMGIMMLAVYGVFLDGTIHDMNAVKNALAVIINLVASILFLHFRMVWIWPALALMIGAIIGGYVVARVSQRMQPDLLRKGVIALGFLLSIWFTLRALGVST